MARVPSRDGRFPFPFLRPSSARATAQVRREGCKVVQVFDLLWRNRTVGAGAVSLTGRFLAYSDRYQPRLYNSGSGITRGFGSARGFRDLGFYLGVICIAAVHARR